MNFEGKNTGVLVLLDEATNVEHPPSTRGALSPFSSGLFDAFTVGLRTQRFRLRAVDGSRTHKRRFLRPPAFPICIPPRSCVRQDLNLQSQAFIPVRRVNPRNRPPPGVDFNPAYTDSATDTLSPYSRSGITLPRFQAG
jgi:hypothetical protein